MTRRRAQAAVLLGCLAAGITFAQSAPTASAAASLPTALPPALLTTLQDVRDFSFDFGQPGFYELLRFVKFSSAADLSAAGEELENWTPLVERPRDFRGRVVTVTGIVGRNSSWRLVGAPLEALGSAWQLELRGSRVPYACTVILTQDADDIPLGARVRISGYFCLVRQYRSETNQVCQAPLLVGVGPSRVETIAPVKPRLPTAWFEPWSIGGAALTLALAGVVIWLRRGRLAVSSARGPLEPPQTVANVAAALEHIARPAAARPDIAGLPEPAQEPRPDDH